MAIAQNQNLVTVKYVLSQLPSSQHRAGLAGLILFIRWLQEQPELKNSVDTVFEIIELDADKAILQFNLAGLTALMKSHFSAGFEEKESKKRELQASKNSKQSNVKFTILIRIKQSLLLSISIQI